MKNQVKKTEGKKMVQEKNRSKRKLLCAKEDERRERVVWDVGLPMKCYQRLR